VTERESYRDTEDRQQSTGGGGSRYQSGGGSGGGSAASNDGFSVRGAPWSAEVPDTSSMDDFPDLASAGGSGSHGRSGVKWGPRR